MESKRGVDYHILQSNLRSYKLIGILDDPRLGEVGVFSPTSPTEPNILAKIVAIYDDEAMDTTQGRHLRLLLHERLSLDCPNLLRLLYYPFLLYQLPERKKIYALLFESFEFDLGKFMEKKIKMQRHFTEVELLQLMRGILNGLASLLRAGCTHNRINPSHIFFHNSIPKLILPSLFTDAVVQSPDSTPIDGTMDIAMIAITILQAALLELYQPCHTSPLSLDDACRANLDTLAGLYSQNFVSLIVYALSINVSDINYVIDLSNRCKNLQDYYSTAVKTAADSQTNLHLYGSTLANSLTIPVPDPISPNSM
jgi:hypothetical protein